MATLRASEIGTYLYCQRAWWYQKCGYEPQNQGGLGMGTQVHDTHGRRVQKARNLTRLAYFLLLAAGVLAIASLILQTSS